MRVKFPPDWSMESILVIALTVAVIVVMFAQSGAEDRTRVVVERSDSIHLVRELRPAFRDDDARPGH